MPLGLINYAMNDDDDNLLDVDEFDEEDEEAGALGPGSSVQDDKEIVPLKTRHAADIRLIGDRTTMREIVLLLAYIRDILDEHRQADVMVHVGYNLKTDPLNFSVNNQEVPSLRAREQISIN